MLNFILSLILSVAVGLLMGIIGGGGGGMYLVILMAIYRENIRLAIGTALILSTITLAAAAVQYWRGKQIRADYFVAMSIAGTIGVAGGTLLAGKIPDNILKYAVCIFFTLSAFSSFLKVGRHTTGETRPLKQALPILAPISIFSGFITGSLGLSGAVIQSTFLIGLFDFPPLLAIGTTIPSTLVFNLTGAAFHAGCNQVDWKMAALLGAGSILGAVIGAGRNQRNPESKRTGLTVVLAVCSLATAVFIAVKR